MRAHLARGLALITRNSPCTDILGHAVHLLILDRTLLHLCVTLSQLRLEPGTFGFSTSVRPTQLLVVDVAACLPSQVCSNAKFKENSGICSKAFPHAAPAFGL
ncbi:hypothetical protein ACS77_28715 [Pseudomonas syringae]|uniref:Uncharacterized protein n=1 Tax=Pseudomonas syringae TaxID=317 RepID=A0A0L1LHQ4_PSESX|nr:hypothetical protein ACS77_28715 [Pseudomonas syringae]